MPGAAPEVGTGYHAAGGTDQPAADDAGDHTGAVAPIVDDAGDHTGPNLSAAPRSTVRRGAAGPLDAPADDPPRESPPALRFRREPATGVYEPPAGIAASYDAADAGRREDPPTTELRAVDPPTTELRAVAPPAIGGAGHEERYETERRADDAAREEAGRDAGPDAGPGVEAEAESAAQHGPGAAHEDLADADLPRVRLTGDGGQPPAAGEDAADEPDAGRRARRSRLSRGTAVKIGAFAAAVAVVAAGGAVTVSLLGGSADPAETEVVTAARPADRPLSPDAQRAAAEQRRRALEEAAARAGRDAFRNPPDLSVKRRPKPRPEGGGAEQATGPLGPVAAGSPREIARSMLPEYGWSPSSQFGCLDRLWQKESGWNPRASSPSGAYGIPQALPGSKMASAGADWRTNPATQIEWGLGYIKGRYGSPCEAWSHSQSVGWY